MPKSIQVLNALSILSRASEFQPPQCGLMMEYLFNCVHHCRSQIDSGEVAQGSFEVIWTHEEVQKNWDALVRLRDCQYIEAIKLILPSHSDKFRQKNLVTIQYQLNSQRIIERANELKDHHPEPSSQLESIQKSFERSAVAGASQVSIGRQSKRWVVPQPFKDMSKFKWKIRSSRS